MYHFFFIHSSVGCFQFLAIVNSAAMNIGYMYLFELCFSLEICPGVRLQDYMIRILIKRKKQNKVP